MLVRKLKQFALAGNILKWIASFLLDRSQSTKVNGECSLPINITRSIVQGSGTGPYAFLTYVSDCKVLGILNFLMKYADDFNLLVPENTRQNLLHFIFNRHMPVEDEMKQIISWSKSN